MRFVLLTQYYPPEPGAASLRLEAMAQQLVCHGHKVLVVAAQPHHLGVGRSSKATGRLWYQETVRGIPVIRTWIWRVSPRRFWLRLLNYFSFVLTGFSGLLRAGKADYVVVESPPLFLGMTAYLYGRWKKVPYILSVSDLWPESAVALGLVKNPTLIRWTRALELFLYRHAAFVSGVTEGICRSIAETGTIAHNRVLFFPNGVDTELFRRVSPENDLIRRLGVSGKQVFLYPGTMGYAQGLDIIIRAAERLQPRDHIRFLLVGEGPVRAELEQEVARRRLSNVIFEPLQPVERMGQYFSLARAVIVPLRKHQLFRGARPSKVFPAWAVGTPVIYAGEGEMAELVQTSGGGLVIPPEDGEALAQAVGRLADLDDRQWRMMAEAGHRFVLEHYTWPVIARQWLGGLAQGG